MYLDKYLKILHYENINHSELKIFFTVVSVKKNY